MPCPHEKALREALEAAQTALARHRLWCGFSQDAPGDGSYNIARATIRAALATEPCKCAERAEAVVEALRVIYAVCIQVQRQHYVSFGRR